MAHPIATYRSRYRKHTVRLTSLAVKHALRRATHDYKSASEYLDSLIQRGQDVPQWALDQFHDARTVYDQVNRIALEFKRR